MGLIWPKLLASSAGYQTIEFVGGAVYTSFASSSARTMALNSGLTGGIASSVSEGDLVIAAYSGYSTADRTLPITDGTTSYTLIGSELYSNDSNDTNLRVAYKFMGSTPDTTTTFDGGGATGDGAGRIVLVFRGVDPTTPLDVAAVTGTGINSCLANPPSITPVTPGAFIVAVGAGATGTTRNTFSSSDLTDFFTGFSQQTRDGTIGAGHKDDWTSGAFNPSAFTFGGSDSTSFSWAAVTLALRPAPA